MYNFGIQFCFDRGYHRFVIILRDPLDAALSEFNRKRSFKQDKEHSHTGHATLDQFEGPDWPFFVKHYFKSWKEFYEQAATFGSNKVCVLVYENLIQDVVGELKGCTAFLGFQLNSEQGKCIGKDQEGGFHRAPMSKEDLEIIFAKPFTTQELDYFNTTKIQVMQKLLANSYNHANKSSK